MITTLENASSRRAARSASAASPDTVAYGDQPTTSSVNRVLQVSRCATDLGLERVRQHLFARFTHVSPLLLPGIDLFNIFWQSGMRSGPEDFRLGRRELFVCEHARGVQLCEVFDLVGRVRRRRRILRLVLLVVGSRLVLVVVGSRLVVVCRLLLPGLLGLVVSYRPPGNRPGNERPPPCPSPESHGEPLPVFPKTHPATCGPGP